jgi:hypothetical protein
MQNRKKYVLLLGVLLSLALIAIIATAKDMGYSMQTVASVSAKQSVPVINPVTAGENEVIVPNKPISVMITATKGRQEATREAIVKSGEATVTTCLWKEEKLVSGGYDKLATMHVWILGETVYSQVVVDKSVCPDK